MPDTIRKGTMTFVVTMAITDRGKYHLADDDDLRPLCGAKPTQRVTAITAKEFKPWPSGARFNCERCYYLRLTDGKWDGR